MSLAEEFYKENIQRCLRQTKDLNYKVKIIGWSRLFVVILGLLTDYILYSQNKLNLILIPTIFFIGIFIVLIFLPQ